MVQNKKNKKEVRAQKILRAAIIGGVAYYVGYKVGQDEMKKGNFKSAYWGDLPNTLKHNNIKSSYVVLDGDHGHDSFLFYKEKYSKIIEKFIAVNPINLNCCEILSFIKVPINNCKIKQIDYI